MSFKRRPTAFSNDEGAESEKEDVQLDWVFKASFEGPEVKMFELTILKPVVFNPVLVDRKHSTTNDKEAKGCFTAGSVTPSVGGVVVVVVVESAVLGSHRRIYVHLGERERGGSRIDGGGWKSEVEGGRGRR